MARELAVAAIPLVFILILYNTNGAFFENHYDDAYITYRYAANLARGNGLVFNVGEKTNSASSLLFTLILSFFYKIGLTNLEFVSVAINIFSVAGISLMVYKSILSSTKNLFLAVILSLFTGVHGFISGWSVSGMETVFFSFLISAFIYQYFFQKKKNWTLIALTMILILLTRAESILLLIAWLFSEIYSVFVIKKGNKNLFLLQATTFFFTVFALYIFQYKYYGSFLSDALIFKRITTYYQPNSYHIFLVWGGTALVFTFLAFYSFFLAKSKKLLFLYLYVVLSFTSLLIGPYSDGARYSVHLFPIIVILSSLTLHSMLSRGLQKKNLRRVGFIFFLIFIQTILSTFVTREYMIGLRQGQACRREIGRYIKNNLVNTDYVLSSDIGMIAYQALDVRFIDLAGLTSKDVLELYRQKKIFDPIILSKKPKLLADTFSLNNEKELFHALTTNQVEYIKGMGLYTNLPFRLTFQDVVYKCSDGKRVYAIVDLKRLYQNSYEKI